MKKFVSMLVLVAFVIAFAQLAFAAQTGGLGQVGNFTLLVRNADALKALQLSADQEKQFDEAVKTLKAALEGNPASPQKVKNEFTAKVQKLLTPDQVKAAQVLAFQGSGGLKVSKTGVGAAGSVFALEALGITPDQKKAVQDIQKKTSAAIKEAGDSEEGKKKADALRKEQVQAVAKLLTPAQKELAEKLTAEKPSFLAPKPKRNQ